MKELMSFLNQHTGLIIIIIAIACILIGRVWSDILNWGEITDPRVIIKNGKEYKLLNLYIQKSWTEDWIVDSIVCLESQHRSFFAKKTKEIYVSGDKIRFSGADGPCIGLLYQAVFPKTTNGSIELKPVKMPA
jgi:hypothetical protein